MKILIIGPPPAIGGTEIHLARIIPRLMSAGIAVQQEFVHNLGSIATITHRINTYKPNIIHYFLPRPYIVGSLASILTSHKAKQIMSRRCLRDCYSYNWIERQFHSRIDRFVGNSFAVCRELHEETHKSPTLIHSGVLIPPITPTEDEIFTITCVGNPRPYKGHDDLRAAYALIKDKLPQPNQLTFVTSERSPLYHLRQSDLFVLPSHTEGFSNALLEAMALGLPCIATRVGGNPDAIQHNISGVLVAPRQPRELAEAIYELAWDRKRCERLGRNARETVRRNFTLDRCVDRYLNLYKQVACSG